MGAQSRDLWVMAAGLFVADLAEPGSLAFVDLPFMVCAQVSLVKFAPSIGDVDTTVARSIGAGCIDPAGAPSLCDRPRRLQMGFNQWHGLNSLRQ